MANKDRLSLCFPLVLRWLEALFVEHSTVEGGGEVINRKTADCVICYQWVFRLCQYIAILQCILQRREAGRDLATGRENQLCTVFIQGVDEIVSSHTKNNDFSIMKTVIAEMLSSFYLLSKIISILRNCSSSSDWQWHAKDTTSNWMLQLGRTAENLLIWEVTWLLERTELKFQLLLTS